MGGGEMGAGSSDWEAPWDAGRLSRERAARDAAQLRKGTKAQEPSRESPHSRKNQGGRRLVAESGDIAPSDTIDMGGNVEQLYMPPEAIARLAVAEAVRLEED